MKLFRHRDLVAVIDDEEVRGVNGKYVNPPLLFVCAYNDEQDCWGCQTISWRSAVALAPSDMNVIDDHIRREREKRQIELDRSLKNRQFDEQLAEVDYKVRKFR